MNGGKKWCLCLFIIIMVVPPWWWPGPMIGPPLYPGLYGAAATAPLSPNVAAKIAIRRIPSPFFIYYTSTCIYLTQIFTPV